MELTVSQPVNTETIKGGTYRAILTSLVQEETKGESQFDNTNPFFLRWIFTIKGKSKSVEIWSSSSTNFGPKAKAYAWACALLGRKLQPGEKINTEQLINCPCMIEVELGTDDRGFDKNKVLTVTAIPTDNEPF